MTMLQWTAISASSTRAAKIISILLIGSCSLSCLGEPLKRSVRWVLGEIMTRTEMLSNFVIGGFGAVGQGIWLAHTLDSYPFKILNSPPGQFYSSVGFLLAFASPLLSLLALRI